jgi:Transcriptional regulator.
MQINVIKKIGHWMLNKKTGKKAIYVPSEEKQYAVLQYICKHPGCKSAEISAKTKLSSRTVERSISELKKQGLIEHTGSKKTGGYKAVNNPPEEKGEEAERKE